MSTIVFLALLSCAQFTFSLHEVKKHGGSHEKDRCKTGLCSNIIDGFNYDPYEEPTYVNSVDEAGCCVICALMGGCVAWGLEADESTQIQHVSQCVIFDYLYQDPDDTEFEPQETYGQLNNRTDIDIDCWLEDGWCFYGGPNYENPAYSFGDCCDQCKTYQGNFWAFLCAGIPLHCSYFTYANDSNLCYIFDNYQVDDMELGSDCQSGYLALDTIEKCHAQHGYSYSGTNLFGGEPVYPVTPAMCCSICKTTAGCKAWTWFFYTGLTYEYLFYFGEWIEYDVYGICFLKSEKGHLLGDDPTTISGYL